MRNVQGDDEWIEEKRLGAGGFGTVTLWRCKSTNEYLAVKKCRLDLSPTNCLRWNQEVDILKKFNHPNIVKAIEAPDAIRVTDGNLPLLAMEFCEGGDLRKLLSTPDNIRGLRESEVLRVTEDIANAIQFLHSKRIIHRDLKPENIVIKNKDGKHIYKLIDLGYAKQLDQSSLATTLVGTLRYLAPELLSSSRSHTKSVDYWSLGTVLFECITGIRPFPDLSPVEWHRDVQQKSPKHIHAYFNAEDNLTFSEVFPELNTLSGFFQAKYVRLLRQLLLWDPSKRGGQLFEDGTRQCFRVLDEILNAKTVQIFCAFTSTLLTFEVTDTDRRDDINARIYEETQIAIDDQEIITFAGQEVTSDALMMQYSDKKDSTPSVLYLFSKSTIPASPRPLFTLPSTMQSIVTESKTLLPYPEQKRIHAEALSFCHKQKDDYQHLINAHRALLKYMYKLHSKVTQFRQNLTSDCIRLEERIAFCKESLNTDVERYSEVAVDLHASDYILRSWREGERNWFKFDKNGVMEVERCVILAQTQVLELQKIHFNQAQLSNHMGEIYNSAVNVYEEFKKANLTSFDRKMADCSKIAEIVLRCLTKKDKLNKEMFSQLKKILQCSIQLQMAIPEIKKKSQEIAEHKKRILEVQKQRQEDIWSLMKNTQDSVDSSFNYPTSDTPTFSSHRMDSNDLMQQSRRSIDRLSSIIESVKLEDDDVKPQILDWSFLDIGTDE